jgi:hypothetical protein
VILRNAGRVSATDAERIAHERYAAFDASRAAAQAANAPSELDELKRIADTAAKSGQKTSFPKAKGRRP